MTKTWLAIVLFIAVAVAPFAQGIGLSSSYKGAADAYREAAAKAPASRRQCYLAWAAYYDGVVASLQRSNAPMPSEPALDPGCPAGSSAGAGAAVGVGSGNMYASNPAIAQGGVSGALASGLNSLQSYISQRQADLRSRYDASWNEYGRRQRAMAKNDYPELNMAIDDQELIQMILDGKPINAQDMAGTTALMNAAIGKNPYKMRLLLRFGADTEIEGTQGRTALSEAASDGCLQCVLALVAAGANYRHVPYFLPETPTQTALKDGFHEIARLFAYLDKPDPDFRARLETLKPRSPSENALNRAALEGAVDDIADFLAAGVSPDAQDDYSFTPLLNAARNFRLDAVKKLLEHHASPDLPNAFGQTPLMLAARQARVLKTSPVAKLEEGPSKPILDALLAAGADKLKKDFAGLTALDYFLKPLSFDPGNANRQPSALVIERLLGAR